MDYLKESGVMHKVSKAPLPIVFAALLIASGPSWNSKPPKQWNEADAKQILTDSPWVRKVTPAELPKRNENAVRQSGLMGAGQSVGIDAIGGASALTGVGATQPIRHGARPKALQVEVRWESALPVRAAELKAREEDLPEWEGLVYAIAIYDVPDLDASRKSLTKWLSKEAYLKRHGKKDLRPVGVNLLPQEGGLTTIVYLFPRSEEITTEDQRVEFTAVFGRLSLAQYFYPAQMQFLGKLEL
jgi:hypothetical protein